MEQDTALYGPKLRVCVLRAAPWAVDVALTVACPQRQSPSPTCPHLLPPPYPTPVGPFTILKEDQFPGMRSSRIPQHIDGAPNFRGLPGMPIFGSGMPTIEGIVAVLRVRAHGGGCVWGLEVGLRGERVVPFNELRRQSGTLSLGWTPRAHGPVT